MHSSVWWRHVVVWLSYMVLSCIHACLLTRLVLWSCREHEPSTMSPLIRSLLSRIVLGQPSKPTVQLPRVPTFNFLAEDILGASDQPGAAGELE